MKLFEFLRQFIEGKPVYDNGEIVSYQGGLTPAFTDLIIATVFAVFLIIVTVILLLIAKRILITAINRRVERNKKEAKRLQKLEEGQVKDKKLSDFNVKLRADLKVESPYEFVDQEKRAETIVRATYKIVASLVWLIVFIIILDAYSINVIPVITGAGIIGIAIAFGAQEFVKDFISGLFNIFENTYSVGESVKIGDFTGTVREIGLRTTKIENWQGDYLIINNGQINKIINRSRDVSTAVIDVVLSNKVEVNKVIDSIKKFIQNYESNHPDYTGKINFVGMLEADLVSYTFRLTSLTPPAKPYGVEREIRAALMAHLEKEGFEGPQPAIVVQAK